MIRNQPLKWYDKILVEPKQEKFTMIKIDDDYHIDFNTFYPSLEKFLLTEKISSDFLNGKFGTIEIKEYEIGLTNSLNTLLKRIL